MLHAEALLDERQDFNIQKSATGTRPGPVGAIMPGRWGFHEYVPNRAAFAGGCDQPGAATKSEHCARTEGPGSDAGHRHPNSRDCAAKSERRREVFGRRTECRGPGISFTGGKRLHVRHGPKLVLAN